MSPDAPTLPQDAHSPRTPHARRGAIWTPCPGSSQRPTEVIWDRHVLKGRCPICGRVKALTKRSERLVRHAAQEQA
jgi:hypothetical protein